ncbi:MAG TPA: catalase-related domain-containing protein, partial [Solirubrobacteraceae bacterium]
GQKIRKRSESFADHFSQATLFWNSMSEWEKQHILDAFKFELGKVDHQHIREGVVAHLAQVDSGLAEAVAEGVGVAAPQTSGANHGKRSPALSQAEQTQSAATRRVAVLVADGVDADSLKQALAPLREQGVACELLAPRDGTLRSSSGSSLDSDRALTTMSSVLYDGVIVAGGEQSVQALLENGEAVHYASEAYKHAKPVGAIGAGVLLLQRSPIPDDALAERDVGLVERDGLVTLAGDSDPERFGPAFAKALAAHRHFERDVAAVAA